MLTIAKDMIKKYNIQLLGYDFMGYPFNIIDDLSYHHLVIPRCCCHFYGLREGQTEWNGAILNRKTAHPYLHIIEGKDEDVFFDITSEIRDMLIKGYLDLENIKYIDSILSSFEKEHCGKRYIKEKYTKRILHK